MHIQKIKITNFKSIYEPLELNFNEITGLWKISGSVGAGKTTIGEAIIFGLFGSVGGKNNSDLISWGEKHGLVETWCTSKGRSIYIKREMNSYGQSPIYVEIDGEELIFTNKRDAQQQLEKEYFDTSKVALELLCIISFNNFKSLATLNTSDAKKFLDQVLGFYTLTQYADKCKELKYNNLKYALTVYIWLNGFKVILGSYLINRVDACANTNPLVDNRMYYEEYNVNIINPRKIVYGEEWKTFREVLCKEKESSNYTGIDLILQLDPIEYNEDSDCYVNILTCSGGENIISLSDFNEDDMRLSISHNLFSNDDNLPKINCVLNFNSEYEQTLDGFKEYIIETYNIFPGKINISYDLALRDDDNIYFYNTHSGEDLTYDFYDIDSLGLSDFERISWDWVNAYEKANKTPLYLQCMTNVYINDNLFLYFKSNKIPMTNEILSYFIYPRVSIADELDEFWKLKKVELNSVDMNLYNINVVNKTENIIKQFDYVSGDSKSNIVQPIFYKVQPLSSITLHRDVVENIAINLDQYKSKVKRFKLKIGNTTLIEAGRVKAGIVFVTNPANMSGVSKSGVYHILNERGSVVTSGNYTCI